jgi:hypothetical protein
LRKVSAVFAVTIFPLLRQPLFFADRQRQDVYAQGYKCKYTVVYIGLALKLNNLFVCCHYWFFKKGRQGRDEKGEKKTGSKFGAKTFNRG